MARSPQASKGTPESMRAVGRASAERGERKAERIDGGAELEAKEANIDYFSRIWAVEILISVKGEVTKLMEDYYSLMVKLQLTQKELERVKEELREKSVLLESLKEATRAK